MLSYSKTKEGHFIVTEKMLSWRKDTTMIIEYTPNLKLKRVNKQQWQETNIADRQWFENHYREHYSVCGTV